MKKKKRKESARLELSFVRGAEEGPVRQAWTARFENDFGHNNATETTWTCIAYGRSNVL